MHLAGSGQLLEASRFMQSDAKIKTAVRAAVEINDVAEVERILSEFRDNFVEPASVKANQPKPTPSNIKLPVVKK